MNTTYIRLLNAIELFSKEHLQIKKFASDFPGQMPNFATINEEYPILFVSPSTSIFDQNTNTFNISVYCFDIIQKDRMNINTILSDTNQIVNDLHRWLLDGEIPGIDLVNATTAEPLNNALLDYAAGWVMNLTLEVSTYGICEIPFNEVPAISEVVNGISYGRYLTCETLEDCSIITTIQEQIDGLLYLSPVITSFTNNINNVIKGSIITNLTLNWATNKVMLYSSINQGIGDVTGLNSKSITGQNITSNKTFTLTVGDLTNTASRTTSITFSNKRFSGTSLESDLLLLDIDSLQNSELSDSRLQTRTFIGDGGYMVFAYPSSFGVASFIVNGLTNNAFTTLVKNYTNEKGFTEQYRLYRTDFNQYGNLTIQVK